MGIRVYINSPDNSASSIVCTAYIPGVVNPVYARDAAADPAYNLVRATVPVAVNGPLYVRLRSVGLNGKAEVQTGKGWSDIKFIDISFN